MVPKQNDQIDASIAPPQDQHNQSNTSPSFTTRDPIAIGSSISDLQPVPNYAAQGTGITLPQNGIEPTFGGSLPMLPSLFPQIPAPGSDAVGPDLPGANDNNARNYRTYARLTPSTSPNASDSTDSNTAAWPIRPDNEVDVEQAHYIHPSAVTGDARIDRTTEFLLVALEESLEAMGPLAPPGLLSRVFGTYVHTDFGNRVRALDLPGIGSTGVEHSFALEDIGEIIYYGLPGTIRTDVVLKDRFGTPIVIYDLKTGSAKLSPARIRQLREKVGNLDIPIIELRYGDLTALGR
jgi:hypothetical protein